MDSQISNLGDNSDLATPFSVKNLLNLNSSESTLAGHLSLGSTRHSSCVLDSLVSVCSTPSQNAAAAAAAMSGYPAAAVSSAAGYHHMDHAAGLMMGHPAPHLHHNPHLPGDGGGGGGSGGSGGGLLAGLDISTTPTSSSCEYGGGGTLLPPHHPGLAAPVAPPHHPAAAPVPPSYSSLPDLTQATLRLGSEFGLQDGTPPPPPPVTSPPSSISSLASTSVNLCSSSRDVNIDKSKFKSTSFVILT